MKIKQVKINGFGKLENKEIRFHPGINIIYGKNETGKSTLLKFIIGMFYGLSKNKNGQTIPDIERFAPWKTEEFSGKIKYELDNTNEYEVYRDFKKKNPKIFDHHLEEISHQFTIDKTKGNQFFVDQVGIEEELFTTSVVTKQGEVKLDEKSQNTMIQKISNILGTGEDTSSYSKIVAKLKKKLNDEIGTNLTKEKPINIIENRIQQIEKEKKELEAYQEEKFILEKNQTDKKEKLAKAKERLASLRTAKLQIDKIEAEESKINVAKKLVAETEKQIETLNEKEQREQTNSNQKTTKKSYCILEMIAVVIAIGCLIIGKNLFIKWLPLSIPIVLGAGILFKNRQYKREEKEIKKKYQKERRDLENTKKLQIEEAEALEKNYQKRLEEIYQQYHLEESQDIVKELDQSQTLVNELTLELHSMELDDQTILPKLEKLVNIEEEWECLQEEKEELEQKRRQIQQVIATLEIAYQTMKEEITPKFTEQLSKAIYKISDGKYQQVTMNTSGEMVVETKTGDYVNAENLSIGTVDQLYVSLRLAALEEITKEKMPIILDEAFAYYDNERLTNILEYLSQEYEDRQVIIFTCTKREKEILEKMKIEYQLIEL